MVVTTESSRIPQAMIIIITYSPLLETPLHLLECLSDMSLNLVLFRPVFLM